MKIDRRAFLLSGSLAAACGRRKGAGYPGHAFVVNAGGRSVSVVDLTTFRVAREISLQTEPGAILSAAAVLVLLPEGAVVQEIDARRMTPARRVRLGGRASQMRMSSDGRWLWVLCAEPPSLVCINPDRMRVAGRIKLPAVPVDFDMELMAAVAFGGAHPAVIVSLEKGFVEREIKMSEEIRLVRFRSDGRQILAAGPQSRMVSVADVATGKMVVRLPVAMEPRQFCFKADGGQLFVTGAGMDAVAIIHPYQTEVSETLLAGHAPGVMAASWITPEYLFVANPDSDDVTVVDIETRRVVAAIRVGQEPGHILFTPDNQYALVLNRRSGDLAVVRMASILGSRPKTVPRTRTAPLFTMIPVGLQPVSAVVRAV